MDRPTDLPTDLPTDPGSDRRSLDRTLARRVIAASLVLGVLAEGLLHDVAYGVNVLALTAAVLVGARLVRRPGRTMDPADAWLPALALVFAGLVAVRGDPFLVVLDILAAAFCTGGAVVAMSGLSVTRRAASVIALAAALGSAQVLVGMPYAIERSEPGLSRTTRPHPWWLGALARGLLLGIPLAVIFAVLFASADPIFARTVEDVVTFRIDLGDLPGRVLFALCAAWFIGGLIAIASTGLPGIERASLGAAARPVLAVPDRAIGTLEAIAILVSIDLVVAAFVGFQVAYLFGDRSTLEAIGMTYADYARQGFFQLVAAACLAIAVIVVLEGVVERRSRPYVAAILGLVGLTAVVLVSAGLRLRLYQDAYGWTELRAWVLAAIITIGVGLTATAVIVVAGRSRWLCHTLAIIGLGSLVVLNLAAPAAIVAEENVARVIDPSRVPPDGHTGLDEDYLAVLPDDAVPVLVAALPRLPPAERDAVAAMLERRRTRLERDASASVPAAFNLGRERARAALATLP